MSSQEFGSDSTWSPFSSQFSESQPIDSDVTSHSTKNEGDSGTFGFTEETEEVLDQSEASGQFFFVPLLYLLTLFR